MQRTPMLQEVIDESIRALEEFRWQNEAYLRWPLPEVPDVDPEAPAVVNGHASGFKPSEK